MKKVLFAVVALGAAALSANAQDTKTDNHKVTVQIPSIALLDLEADGNALDITLAVEAPTEAGENVILTNATNSDLWINYTSIVNKNTSSPNQTRKVSVKSSGTVAGLDLKVAAAAATSDGKGTKGTAAGSALTLTTSDQDIITGIGSCFTGNGDGKGHNLTYSLALSNNGDDFNLLDNDLNNTELTVTYTISDN